MQSEDGDGPHTSMIYPSAPVSIHSLAPCQHLRAG
jgi:hypothetical protein